MASVQSVDRSFALLQAISRQPSGISELSREVGLPTSTVARLLNTLENLGAVERIEHGNFRIGAAILTIASSVDPSRNITAVAQTHLIDLVEQLGEAVGLSVEVGYEVKYVAQVDGPNEVQVRDWTGESLPMHVVCSGLVFLSHWDEDALEGFLARSHSQFTPNSMVDPDQLRLRIIKARADGYAWTRDELAEGLSSVAVPIFSSSGDVIGAMHCHGPSYRFPVAGQEEWIAGLLTERARRITKSLSFQSR